MSFFAFVVLALVQTVGAVREQSDLDILGSGVDTSRELHGNKVIPGNIVAMLNQVETLGGKEKTDLVRAIDAAFKKVTKPNFENYCVAMAKAFNQLSEKSVLDALAPAMNEIKVKLGKSCQWFDDVLSRA